MPPSALLRSATLLVLAVGTQGRPTLDVRPERILSASRHEEDVGMEGVRKHAALAHAVSLAREREQSTFDSSSPADSALRKAIEAGELEGLMDAIHENADTASPKVLDEARALRDTLREAKNLPETLSKSNAASSADAALHEAMESGELNAIMDAIHEHAETASPEVLEDARALRDSLREAKHAAEGTAPPLGRLGHRRQRRHEGSAGEEQAAQGEHSAAYMCKVLGRCPEGSTPTFSHKFPEHSAAYMCKTFGEQCDSAATEQAPRQQAPRQQAPQHQAPSLLSSLRLMAPEQAQDRPASLPAVDPASGAAALAEWRRSRRQGATAAVPSRSSTSA